MRFLPGGSSQGDHIMPQGYQKQERLSRTSGLPADFGQQATPLDTRKHATA